MVVFVSRLWHHAVIFDEFSETVGKMGEYLSGSIKAVLIGHFDDLDTTMAQLGLFSRCFRVIITFVDVDANFKSRYKTYQFEQPLLFWLVRPILCVA